MDFESFAPALKSWVIWDDSVRFVSVLLAFSPAFPRQTPEKSSKGLRLGAEWGATFCRIKRGETCC